MNVAAISYAQAKLNSRTDQKKPGIRSRPVQSPVWLFSDSVAE